MFKIAVLVSGGGSNLQSIIDNVNNGNLQCSIEAVISDKPEAYALVRARENDINTYVVDKKEYKEGLSDKILEIISDVDLIVMAGFFSILQGKLLQRFKNKIINIHPSLIPSFCGKGMYGIKVHEAALKCGVKVTGCTVHFVDEGTDTGPIILQKVVPVLNDDTAKSLQSRVLEMEHESLSEAIRLIYEGKVIINNRKVLVN